MQDQIDRLLERSHVLGADRSITNYAGGNTSCKAPAIDPVTGEPVTVLWIKGSGGDLAALTEDGLAALVLERVTQLANRYQGDEDALVPLLEHCRFAPGPAPSIDTFLHAFLPAAHIDHVHPDAVIALACAAGAAALVADCYGDEVAFVPWRRPGFELGRELESTYGPGMKGIVLGGHGLISWGDTSAESLETTAELVARAAAFLEKRGRGDPLGPVADANKPLDASERRRRASAIAPALRGLCTETARVIARFDDSHEVLDFLSRTQAPRLAAMGTSCPDHFLRTKVRPLWLDGDLAPALAAYADDYRAYYARHAEPGSPGIRGSAPAIVLVPGVGMFSLGPDAHTARVAGEYYRNAIAVMTGAESVSSYDPIADAERFGVEYWDLEDAKLRRRPAPLALAGRVAVVTGAASGIGRAVAWRLAAEGAALVLADLDLEGAEAVAESLGSDAARGVGMDATDEASVEEALASATVAFGGVDILVHSAGLSVSAPLLETSVRDWDRVHNVLARGSFIVSRAAARVMAVQGTGGDIVHVVSKNAVLAGPDNVAYGAAKAAQAHLVRLLATELGSHGVRVNGINPDAVVQGSGIFAGDWGDRRAQVHGVERSELGRFYASRTLLGREVLPEHVAAAVAALVCGDLELTTGTIIPVDGGVPGAFLR